MPARHFAALLSLPLLGLSACMTQPPGVASARLPTYSTDLAGKAANCTVSAVTLEDGKEAVATMKTGGGGWCGIPVRRSDQPLGAALLSQPAKGGNVYVHTVGDDTRVDYTPRAGTSGADSFTVKFIPGDATMRVTVDVDAPAVVARPAAAAPAATTPTTRSRTTTSTRSRSTK